VVEGHEIAASMASRLSPTRLLRDRKQGASGRGAQRAVRRDRCARHQAHACAGARIRARFRRHGALGRRAGRQASAGRRCVAAAAACDADEQLTGAPREAVQTRLDLWLKTHIERLLGPLFALAAAEDIIGIARGVAYQIIESLGVLERQKVAEEVKGLDQTSRGLLRKYVRPLRCLSSLSAGPVEAAPRSLAPNCGCSSMAVRRTRVSPNCSGSRPAAARQCRSKGGAEALYRTIGYRVCGERAIPGRHSGAPWPI